MSPSFKAREMSPEEAARVEAEWNQSKEKRDLDARREAIAARIEEKKYAAYSARG